MKVGDLVTKVSAWEGRVYGIIIAVGEWSELNVEVQWAGYGTVFEFWDSVDRVELINASR